MRKDEMLLVFGYKEREGGQETVAATLALCPLRVTLLDLLVRFSHAGPVRYFFLHSQPASSSWLVIQSLCLY